MSEGAPTSGGEKRKTLEAMQSGESMAGRGNTRGMPREDDCRYKCDPRVQIWCQHPLTMQGLCVGVHSTCGVFPDGKEECMPSLCLPSDHMVTRYIYAY